MRTVLSFALPLALAAALLGTPPAAAADDTKTFPLKDGDIWVFAGDSITAQKLHTNYFEAFCYARYPKLTFHFRNSGVGGHTIPTTMARFGYDIAAWKPTVVSVELGMNDKGGYTVKQYIDNMAKMTAKIREIKARPVFFTASPINNGQTLAKLGATDRLHQYAVELKEFAEKEQAPFADQFHALVDQWAHNKSNEARANSLNAIRALARDDKLEGVEHLREFLAVQEKTGKHLVSMQGDAVHPGAPGQLMMAAALLKELGATGVVSSVALSTDGKKVEAKQCEVSDVKAEDGKLSFDRLDECLSFPIPDEARAVLALDPTILALSQYTLQVSGLPEKKYELKINGTLVATLTSDDLSRGVNLTTFGKGPIAEQGKQILKAVSDKENLVQEWRGKSKTVNGDPEKLTALTAKVEEADGKIRAAAKPRKLHFELTPVK